MTEEQRQIVELKLTVDGLNNKIDKLINVLDSKKPEKESSKLESWIKNISLLLGIPGIIAALIFQLSQTKGSNAVTEKTIAETEQIKINIVKQKTDMVLDTLINLKTKNIKEYKDIVNKELPKLVEAISQIEKVNVQKQNQSIVFKYIALYVVFVALGLLFSLIDTFWSSLLAVLIRIVHSRTKNSYKDKRQERIRNFAETSLFILSPVPRVFELFIRLSIFVAILVPLFNEAAVVLGSNKKFNDIIYSAIHQEFSVTLQSLKSILFR